MTLVRMKTLWMLDQYRTRFSTAFFFAGIFVGHILGCPVTFSLEEDDIIIIIG